MNLSLIIILFCIYCNLCLATNLIAKIDSSDAETLHVKRTNNIRRIPQTEEKEVKEENIPHNLPNTSENEQHKQNQSSQLRLCFNNAVESLNADAKDAVMDQITSYINNYHEEDRIHHETIKLNKSLSQIALTFQDEIFDFATKFNKCSSSSQASANTRSDNVGETSLETPLQGSKFRDLQFTPQLPTINIGISLLFEAVPGPITLKPFFELVGLQTK